MIALSFMPTLLSFCPLAMVMLGLLVFVLKFMMVMPLVFVLLVFMLKFMVVVVLLVVVVVVAILTRSPLITMLVSHCLMARGFPTYHTGLPAVLSQLALRAPI